MTSTQGVASEREIAPARLPSLTGLRAFGALFVFANHAGYILAIHDPELYKDYNFLMWNLGPIALSFFFILSGFVLTWGVKTGDTPSGFWRGRIFKIFPNHLVMYAISVVVLMLSGTAIKVPEAIANLFLVQAWTANTSFFSWPINGVSWSLGAEMLFYALFPLLLLVINKIRVSRLWWWAGGSVVAIFLVPVIALTLVPDGPDSVFGAQGMSWEQHWFVFFFPVTRILEFVFGIILARIVKAGRWPAIELLPAVSVMAGVYVASLYLPKALNMVALYPIPIAMIICAAAVSDLSGQKTLVNRKPLVWLGEISFAFYIVHVNLMFWLHAAFAGTWPGYFLYAPPKWNTTQAVLFIFGVMAACVLVGGALFTLVERPTMRKWSRPRVRRPDAAQLGGPDQVTAPGGPVLASSAERSP